MTETRFCLLPKLSLKFSSFFEIPPITMSPKEVSKEFSPRLHCESGMSFLLSNLEFKDSTSVSGLDSISRRLAEPGASNEDFWNSLPQKSGDFCPIVGPVCDSHISFPSTFGLTPYKFAPDVTVLLEMFST